MHSIDTQEYWFVFQNDQLLLMNSTTLLQKDTLTFLQSNFIRQYYIGPFNEISCYCAEIDKDISLPSNLVLTPLRKVFERLGMDWYVAATKAYSIINWDKNHQFCGRCGNKTTNRKGTFERLCPECGLAFYPRISPSIIVLVKKDDDILMARGPHFPPGRFGLIAGYVEAGEGVEDAVHREVFEEVGIRIKNLHYFGSQSWPFPDSLMIAFIAEYESGTLNIDYTEIESAGWYHYDNLPSFPSSFSIARKLVDYFLAGYPIKK